MIMESLEWIVFNAVIVGILLADLMLGKKNNPQSVRQALYWSGLWIVLALAFSLLIFAEHGTEGGIQFLAAYLIEKSLSIDNVFAFYMIFEYFKTPPKDQRKVLIWGVCGALIMRALLIILGSALIARYQWILYVFGVFLIWTGIKMLKKDDATTQDLSQNICVTWLQKIIPLTQNNAKARFFNHQNGRWHMTTLFLALVLIELTDLIFAMDSIPAVFAISQDPFIVYTSNVFAILGLRALYFALSGILERFQNLKIGLSIILMMIGAKMLLAHWIELPVWFSLIAIIVIVVICMVLPQRQQHRTMPPSSDAAPRKKTSRPQ